VWGGVGGVMVVGGGGPVEGQGFQWSLCHSKERRSLGAQTCCLEQEDRGSRLGNRAAGGSRLQQWPPLAARAAGVCLGCHASALRTHFRPRWQHVSVLAGGMLLLPGISCIVP
jgi:hypothetical protein